MTFLGAAVRIGAFVHRFGRWTLQMDFSAFYTAGESLNHGLSPYVNNFRAGIWDGVDSYLHSRFLYPPLVASLFQPVADLRYSTAKVVWMCIALGCLAFALWVAVRAAGMGSRVEPLLGAGISAALFFPLLTLLERGQIDTVTLALVTLAAWGLSAGSAIPGGAGLPAWRRYGAGALLALATLLKLNIVYLVPFLILRRQWKALLGFAAGGLLVLLASVAINGPALVRSYVHTDLPRVELYGEGGPGALPSADFRSLLIRVPSGDTRQDGVVYPTAYFGFVANGTLVRALARHFPKLNQSRLSLRLFEISLGFMVLLEGLFWLRGVPPRGEDEFAYWNIVFDIVLFTGPLTWVMNVVWLLPVVAVVMGQLRRPGNLLQGIALGACALGLVWAALPDMGSFSMLLPDGVRWKLLGDPWKYPAAELAVFFGLVLLLAAAPRRVPPAGQA